MVGSISPDLARFDKLQGFTRFYKSRQDLTRCGKILQYFPRYGKMWRNVATFDKTQIAPQFGYLARIPMLASRIFNSLTAQFVIFHDIAKTVSKQRTDLYRFLPF